jgi:hypothetical protein
MLHLIVLSVTYFKEKMQENCMSMHTFVLKLHDGSRLLPFSCNDNLPIMNLPRLQISPFLPAYL